MKTLFSFLLVFSFIVCAYIGVPRPQKTTVITENKRDFAIKIPTIYPDFEIQKFSCYEEEGIEKMAIVGRISPTTFAILVYNLQEKNLIEQAEIPIDGRKHKYITGMNAINSDSVYLQLAPYEEQLFREDSTLLLCNTRGKINKILALESLPIPTNKKHTIQNTKESIYYSTSHQMPIATNALIIPFRKVDIGEEDATKTGKLLVGEYNLQSNQFSPYPIQYPDNFLTKTWAQSYPIVGCDIDLNDNVLIGVGFQSDIWEYNRKTKQVKTIPLEGSDFIGDIRPMDLDKQGMPTHGELFESDAGGYAFIFADKHKKQYIRIVSLPTKLYGTHDLGSMPKSSIILYDSSYRKLGEGITEKFIVPIAPFQIIREGCIDLNYTKADRAGDSIYFSVFDFKVGDEKKVVSPQKTKISAKQDVLTYLEQYYPQVLSTDKSVLIVSHIQNTCHGCLVNIFQELGTKNALSMYPNVYFVMIFEEDIDPNVYTKVNNLTNPNLLVEYQKRYKPFFSQGYNPTVYYLKKGKLAESMAITPFNEKEALQIVQNFVKK